MHETVASHFADVIAHFFNVSVRIGVFSAILNLLRIDPIFKSGDNPKPKNY